MAFSVNTNAGALDALRQLSTTNAGLTETQERINTGLKVRTAADDPANFAIAQNLRGQLKGFEAVRSSLDRASSTVDVAIAAAETISDLLIEARETTIAAADTGIDNASRQALSDEYGRLLEQINSVVSQANFNGINLVDASLARITALTGTEVQVNDVNGDGVVDAGEANLVNSIDIAGQDLTTTGLSMATNSFEVDPAIGYDINVQDLGDVTQNLDDRDFIEALTALGNPDGIIDDTTNPATLNLSGATFTDADDTLTFSLGGEDFSFDTSTAAASLDDAIAELEAAGFDQALVVDAMGNPDDFDVTATPSDNFSSNVRAEQALVEVDDALDLVNRILAEFGAAARQLELSTNFTTRLSDEIDIGIGNLVDADMARESSQLQSLQVKQQLGLQALSIANGSPQSILSLFGN